MSGKVAVTYEGPTKRDESGDYFQIDGEDGTTYTLYRDAATEVPPDVAQRLEEYEGHRFEVGNEAQATVPELKAELDALDVEYPSDAKKGELQDLLTEAKTTEPEPA